MWSWERIYKQTLSSFSPVNCTSICFNFPVVTLNVSEAMFNFLFSSKKKEKNGEIANLSSAPVRYYEQHFEMRYESK